MRRFFFCGALLATTAHAHAAIFAVTQVTDTNSGSCGANCSLREAITAANSSVGADTIEFAIPGCRISLKYKP